MKKRVRGSSAGLMEEKAFLLEEGASVARLISDAAS